MKFGIHLSSRGWIQRFEGFGTWTERVGFPLQ